MVTEENSSVRARIMQEATDLFMKQGYNGVSMREIAETCELSKAGLYYHFKDKSDLFLEILYSNLGMLSDLVKRCAAMPGGGREQISHFAHGVFTALDVNQNILIRLASQDLKNLSKEQYEKFYQAYQTDFLDGITDMLGRAIDAGEFRKMNVHTATWALLGLLYPFLDARYDSILREQQIEEVLSLFFNGIADSESFYPSFTG
jgi:AcrR family transcriptional regulator